MDATVIEEIANQLGMAVDQAGTFVTNILPQYAGLQTMGSVMIAIVGVIVIVACIVSFKIACSYTAKRVEDEKNDKSYYKYDESERRKTLMYVAIPCVIFGVAAIAMFFIGLYDALGWHFFPEAMLLDMALAKIE